MSTTEPIRNYDDLQHFIAYYQQKKPNPRNYALIQLGLHTALRIGDILSLTWNDVYDFKDNRFVNHLYIKEHKTKKYNNIALNDEVKEALYLHMQYCKPCSHDYIFTKTTDKTKPLDRSSAYRLIKKAAAETSQASTISCHSMRKTFGYYAWKQGAQPALLMDIYNHSSYKITKKYLGIAQDERDSVFMNINFTNINI